MRPKRTPFRDLVRSSALWARLILLTVIAGMPTAAMAVSCTGATGTLAFGTYDTRASLPNDSSSGYVEMRCTCSGLDCIAFGYNIEIQSGGSGDAANRKMKRTGGTETLRYELYRDATHLLPWGEGSSALGGLYLLGQFGSWQRVYVNGRIPAGQAVRSGAYTDTPGVVINF